MLFMGKSTISMAIFQFAMSQITRGFIAVVSSTHFYGYFCQVLKTIGGCDVVHTLRGCITILYGCRVSHGSLNVPIEHHPTIGFH